MRGQSTFSAVVEVRAPVVVRVRNEVKAHSDTKGRAASYPTEFEVLRSPRSRTSCCCQGQGIDTASSIKVKAPDVAEATVLPHTKVKAPEEVKSLAATNPAETELPLPRRSSSADDRQGQGYSAAATEAAFRVKNEVKVPDRATDPINSHPMDVEAPRPSRFSL